MAQRALGSWTKEATEELAAERKKLTDLRDQMQSTRHQVEEVLGPLGPEGVTITARARAAGAAAIDVDGGQYAHAWMSQRLLPAAEDLLEVCDRLAAHDLFWDKLAGTERDTQLEPPTFLDVGQLANFDLVGILTTAGFTQPPDPYTIAPELQAAMEDAADALSRPGRQLTAQRTQEARLQLAFYRYHLRRLVEAAHQAAEKPPAESRSVRTRLVRLVRKGAAGLAAGTIAAGLVAAATAPGGVDTAAMEVLNGMDQQVVQEVITLGIAGATNRLARIFGGQQTAAEPEDVVRATYDTLIRSLDDLVAVGEPSIEAGAPATAERIAKVPGYSIDAMSWYYQLQRARLPFTGQRGTEAAALALEHVSQGLSSVRAWCQADAHDNASFRGAIENLAAATKKLKETWPVDAA